MRAPLTHDARSSRALDERGLAMLTAICVTMIVLALLITLSIAVVGQAGQQRSVRERLASLPWAESAISDLEFKLTSHQIGRQNPLSETPYGAVPSTSVGYELWAVPSESPAGVPAAQQTAQFVTTGRPAPLDRAWRVAITDASGSERIGYYQILSPVENDPGKINMGMFLSGAPYPSRDWGSIEFVIRGWEDSVDGTRIAHIRPATIRATLRRGSLSRYALLADGALQFTAGSTFRSSDDGFPTRIHTNNIRDARNAIEFLGSGSISLPSDRRITTSQGRCVRVPCKSDQSDIVDFVSLQEAYYGAIGVGKQEANDPVSGGPTPNYGGADFQVPDCLDRLANVAVYHGIACGLVPPLEYTYDTNGDLENPYHWGITRWVELVMEGDHVRYRIVMFPTRRDIGGLPFNNDLNMLPDTYRYNPGCCGGAEYRVPRVQSPWFTYHPPPGGAAMLSTYDLVVSGSMDCNHPVTLMAMRVNWSRNMNVYLWQRTGSFIGSDCPQAPVGIVAQGSILVPSFTLDAGKTAGDRGPLGYGPAGGGTNTDLELRNVALATEGGYFGIGTTPLSYMGSIDPCEASKTDTANEHLPQSAGFEGSTNGYGRGNTLRLSGSMAIRSGLKLYYARANGTCVIGYRRREYSYVSRLSWDPPPLFPTDDPWHLSDYEEIRGAV